MTVEDVSDLRKQGRVEDAYDASRSLYAVDKSKDATICMLLTAVDMQRRFLSDGRAEEAEKIALALQRLAVNAPIAEHTLLGLWGEELAVDYLSNKGYIILERDWHSTHKDIDIIVRKGDLTVFVEVKARRNDMFINPAEAVNWKKQQNLRRAINHYIHYRKIDGPIRFDVITIVGTLGSTNPEIEHIEDFALSMR